MRGVGDIRRFIQYVLYESKRDAHITLTGDVVPFGSDECVGDLEDRVADACRQRDHAPRRSDTREHYNALLRSLRRAKKSAIKSRGY